MLQIIWYMLYSRRTLFVNRPRLMYRLMYKVKVKEENRCVSIVFHATKLIVRDFTEMW